jgi:UDP-N-acetylmuramoyl-tripeptide--D-alanyl-D-alanine ligase
VLGDMRELGAHSARAHEAVGRLAGEVGADIVIGVGEGGAAIADAARPHVPDVRTAHDAGEAAAIAAQLVEPGDAVLVKASRALGLQVVAERLLEAAP